MSTATKVVWLGFVGRLLAGLGTALGAASVFAITRLSPKLEDGLLSFSAGVMLAASFFSLLLPAIEYGELEYQSGNMAVIVVIFGFLCGAVALYIIHSHVPHEHFLAGREAPPETRRRGFENPATFSLFIGFACMMYLDATLGRELIGTD